MTPRPTERDLELLRHLANGLTDYDIGEETGVNPHTCCTHILRLRRRVGAINRPHLVAIAMREGWIE